MIYPKDVTCVLITKEDRYPAPILNMLPNFGEIRVLTRCTSLMMRYDLAMPAKHNHIYVQDDDCLVDVLGLLAAYDCKRLTNYMKGEREEWYQEVSGGTVSLVGYGALFPKAALGKLWSLEIKRDWGRFMPIHVDRLFTFANQPFNTIVNNGVIDLPTALSKDRISQQAGWTEDTLEVIRMLREL